MSKTISASDMRDRLLARLNAPQRLDDWVRVIGVAGHRDLLGLIARHQPQSIGELAAMAGRAQPNVSRALSALHSSGLVKVIVDGRHSIPKLTGLGEEKAREFGLLEARDPDRESESARLFEIDPKISESRDVSNDVIAGQLRTQLRWESSVEQKVARTSEDLDALGRRVLEHWWRLLYRRDAPFRLWNFGLDERPGLKFTLTAKTSGIRIELLARGSDGQLLDLDRRAMSFTVDALERLLLDELLRPLAKQHWLEGRSARPLHALLQRIEDSRSQAAERAFCRTAGALGMSPYDLEEERAAQLRNLIEFIPEEDARLEFGSAVLSEELGSGQLWTSEQLQQFRQRNSLPELAALRANCATETKPTRPYSRGYSLARSAREFLKLRDDASIGGVEGLSKLLGAADGIGLSPEAPGSLRGFLSVEEDMPAVIIQNEGPLTSAFVLARGIGDYLAFGNRASCVADLYTDRQAIGRAFAAEFMAPRYSVTRLIEEEDRSVAQVADHFGVSPTVVHRQYENQAH